jgi:hypothetical protein
MPWMSAHLSVGADFVSKVGAVVTRGARSTSMNVKRLCEETLMRNTDETEAHLEEDVGGVKVSVADTFAMHVLHAAHDAMQHGHHRPPAALHAWLQEPSRSNRHAQASSIAVLLQTTNVCSIQLT